jgi:hypothetical protein
MERVKNVASLLSIMMNKKWSVLTKEIEYLLKIWLDDQVQRYVLVSQAVIFS